MQIPRVKDLRATRLRDGRRLEYVETGDPSGRPVFLFHGLPGGCLGVPDAPATTGARVIIPGRPGYGASDPLPNRRIADWPKDIADVADALGVARFAVIGYSMGGPHALACGCLLPQRVAVVGLVSAAGPLPRAMAAEQAAIAGNPAAAPPEYETRSEAPAKISPPETLSNRLLYWTTIAGNVLQQGASGVLGDLAARSRPWGFQVSAIRVPVLIYHGEDDRVVPVSAARQYRQLIPTAVSRFYPGEGHRALWAHVDEILADVLSRWQDRTCGTDDRFSRCDE